MCVSPVTSGPPSARRTCALRPIGWSSSPVLGPAKPDPWDETSVKTNLTRLRGRAPVGERLYGTAPFGKWRTQTFIAGLTSDEPIAPG